MSFLAEETQKPSLLEKVMQNGQPCRGGDAEEMQNGKLSKEGDAEWPALQKNMQTVHCCRGDTECPFFCRRKQPSGEGDTQCPSLKRKQKMNSSI